ncbi:MAG: ATPase, T2SS/T4P/T4SS family [Candidatus Omnitrophota bacterium]|nr:ATPase, T2SS/T4P/T4SS family [Candidatus Omnitrophota bacterium]
MSEASDKVPQPAQESAGKCIVVFGTKGGVGKTVVATNLAVCLSQRLRAPVCLVDLDVTATGDLAKMLSLTVEHAVAELAPQMKRLPPDADVTLDGLMVPHPSGIHVVQCVANPRHSSLLEAPLLARLFGTLKRRYPYVVVDAGKGFTDPLIAAFDEANLILLVATPDIISLYQTKWAMNIIESLLFPPNMVKAVLNRAESRGGVGSEDARLAMPCEVIGEIPSDGRAMGTAINQGSPVVTLYTLSRVTDAFRRLANELIERPQHFLSHQEIPRHHRPADGVKPAAGVALGSARLFAPLEAASADNQEDEIVSLKRRIHERLVEELDLKKVDLAAMSNQAHMQELRERCERVIATLLSRELGGIISSHEVRIRMVKEISDEALGLGPLEELLDDPTVSDILVNNKDQIYVERHGRLELTSKKFISEDQVRAVIERIVAPLGRRIDEANPMVDARLPDGSRVNAIIPPLAIRGAVLSIRKFGHIHLNDEDLIRYVSLTPDMVQFVRACVIARKNIIISGGTGSGKTTLLNVVSRFIPTTERIITLEDAAELRLVQPHTVSLEARPSNVEGKGQVSIRDLFRNALRMRPDRVVIGECRGPETLDMLQAMNTGHEGSITTVHANSPKDVLSRLDSMVLMSNIDMPIPAIREMVASAIHLVIHTARLADGTRKVTSISELVGASGGAGVVFQDIFVFRQTGVAPDGKVLGEFVATGTLPTFLKDFKVKGIAIDEAIFRPAAG